MTTTLRVLPLAVAVLLLALLALALPGCTPPSLSGAATASHDYAAGVLRVRVDATDVAIARHAVSGAILVDGEDTGATAASLKHVAIVGGPWDESVTIDYSQGAFAPGTAAGPGIQLDLGSGQDGVTIILTAHQPPEAAVDVVRYGGTEDEACVSLGPDVLPDVAIRGAGRVTHRVHLRPGDVLDTSGAGGCGRAFAGAVAVDRDD